jgi:glycosyltransferase involved in cell wall biosynthesis
VVRIPNLEWLPAWGRLWVKLAAPLVPLVGRVRGAGWLHWLLTKRVGQPRKALAWWRGQEDFEAPGTRLLPTLINPPPEVVHCHNLHRDYFDLRFLPELSHRIPVVLTLHDEWLLTGHCACSFGCTRWLAGCGQCPALSTYPAIRRDASAFNWQRKRELLTDARVHLVTPSRWLMEKVEQSPIMRGHPQRTVIHNGVDLATFCPGEQCAARQRLGLPELSRIILFAHPGVKESQFKDYPTFARCAGLLASRRLPWPLVFLAVGPSLPEEDVGGARIRFVPRVADRRTMADYYRAADLYLHPARSENFPLAVLEAMACGKPIVASRVGGIPEQVTDAENGFLAAVGDSEAMAAAAEKLLMDAALRQRLGVNGAERAVKYYGLNQMTDAYLRVLSGVLAGPACCKPIS